MIQANSLVRGKIVSGEQFQKNVSPVDGTIISQVNFLSEKDLVDIFSKTKRIREDRIKEDYSELFKLAQFFRQNHLKFTNQIIRDAGFIKKDAQDLVDCSIEFCNDYFKHIKQIYTADMETSFTFKKGSNQKIRLTSSPFGLISVTTPRNTPLITELTVIVHALWSGNVVVLRPSPGVAGTVSLLIEGLLKSFTPQTLNGLNIVFSDAKNFVNIGLDYSDLFHYIGSTKYLENTLITGIKKGVKVLVDGDGCSLMLVDSTSNIEEAAKTCYQALVRCNGQICISVRVIVVEQKVYKKFLSYFLDLVKKTIIAPPSLDNQPDMGPLFSTLQVESIINVARKYKSIYSPTILTYGSNYISPTVVELKPNDSSFLKESVFGPIVGISYFKGDDWKRWLTENTINLTDAVFSKDKVFIEEFLATSKSPRKVVNLDPTIESVFEPWGAFLPSGWNDVSYWYFKYRKYYQLVTE